MTDLESAESNLLHKLCDELRAAVLELGEAVYESTSSAVMVLRGNGKSFTYRLDIKCVSLARAGRVPEPARFELVSNLWDGDQKVAEVAWIKTEDSVTRVLGFVRALVAKYLA